MDLSEKIYWLGGFSAQDHPQAKKKKKKDNNLKTIREWKAKTETQIG